MDERKTVFWCEDTVDGIFTAVYEAWASRLGLANVTIQTGEGQTMSLFASYRQVETDHEKAARVAETIRNKMGWEDYQVIYQAALADDPKKGEAIFGTLVLGLAVLKKKNITRNLQEPAVMKTFELSRRVGNESHRYRMFVRFRELAAFERGVSGPQGFGPAVPVWEREGCEGNLILRNQEKEETAEQPQGLFPEDGIDLPEASMPSAQSSALMFSEIEPENRILATLGAHFTDRFPMMNFAIYDRTHRECLVHPAGKGWAVLEDVDLEEDLIRCYSRKEQEFARLWKGFVKSISIEERSNPRCQRNFMPKKYWKHMTEQEMTE